MYRRPWTLGWKRLEPGGDVFDQPPVDVRISKLGGILATGDARTIGATDRLERDVLEWRFRTNGAQGIGKPQRSFERLGIDRLAILHRHSSNLEYISAIASH